MPILESVCVSVSTQVRWADHGEAPRSNSYLGTCRLEGVLEASVTPPGLGVSHSGEGMGSTPPCFLLFPNSGSKPRGLSAELLPPLRET